MRQIVQLVLVDNCAHKTVQYTTQYSQQSTYDKKISDLRLSDAENEIRFVLI